MIEFKILKKSKKSSARLGILKTPHGEVETPAFVPVATAATVKALTVPQVLETGTQLLIANTYHLHLRPTEKVVAKHGGIHKFMRWPRPLMTDSGGFQVFSLGFGRDLGTTKVQHSKDEAPVALGAQPRLIRITDAGVEFVSWVDGRKILLGPKQSIRIQQQIGADIIYAFDECPPPQADKKYMANSLIRTHRWAQESLDARTSNQAMYGIVQGGRWRDLRVESASIIGKMGFDGFGIGGEFGESKTALSSMLGWIFPALPENKPRHLLGIGHPADFPVVGKAGVDTFDCIAPTHYARRGIVFTPKGRLDLARLSFLNDRKPIDPKCTCMVCGQYTRSYLAHLIRAKEISGLSLLTFHNLHYFNAMAAALRDGIKKGKI